MAITAAVASTTPHSITMLLTHDAQAGDALVITNAVLVAALTGNAEAGPLLELLSNDIAGLNTALARRVMLGDAAGGSLDEAGDRGFCYCELKPRTGQGIFTVDADTDAVNALRPELNIAGTPAVAATAYLTIKWQHTLTK